LDSLSPDNAQGELLLTDIVPVALHQGLNVATIVISDAHEAVGANTPEQLGVLEAVAIDLDRAARGSAST
jgi:bifunctional UDP-N-acetylglucosamine pyrophosphorylase / glucosamine-1-phosphate N-acetyltransferase